MGLHPNAKLGPAGRRAMVLLVVDERLSQRAAAACCGVGKTTAKRWVDRYREASADDRLSGRCFCDRSSRPHTSPGQLAAVGLSGSVWRGSGRGGGRG
jgi:hypothetical protein